MKKSEYRSDNKRFLCPKVDAFFGKKIKKTNLCTKSLSKANNFLDLQYLLWYMLLSVVSACIGRK